MKIYKGKINNDNVVIKWQSYYNNPSFKGELEMKGYINNKQITFEECLEIRNKYYDFFSKDDNNNKTSFLIKLRNICDNMLYDS